jgi:hypothetical protein
MNIRNKDLNLLAVFVGISEELNLSRASGRLGLSHLRDLCAHYTSSSEQH